MIKFNWQTDKQFIAWGSTIIHNLTRAVAAGIVFGIFSLVFVLLGGGPPGVPVLESLLYSFLFPVFFPIIYIIWILPMYLFGRFIANIGDVVDGLPGVVLYFAGISLQKLMSLCVVIGDPIIFILKKYQPEFVMVETPPFLDFNVISYVLDYNK